MTLDKMWPFPQIRLVVMYKSTKSIWKASVKLCCLNKRCFGAQSIGNKHCVESRSGVVGGQPWMSPHIPPAARNKISTWDPSQDNFC